MSRTLRIAVIFPLALLMVLFGILILVRVPQTLRTWQHFSVPYATIWALWFVAAPAMLIAGVWAVASLGRKPAPLWIAGTAAALIGASSIAGVLTDVIPCSGPS